jgi:5-methylcytosine-specific restriction protein A
MQPMVGNEYKDYPGDYYTLNEIDSDPRRIKSEREKARKLKKTQWWLNKLNRGLCHYCEKKFKSSQLTLDHVVPLARGGTTTQGNVVPACKACNQDKKLHTPVDQILSQLAKKNSNENTE